MSQVALEKANPVNPYWPAPIDDLVDLGKSAEGRKDLLEGLVNIFEWMSHLGINRSFADKATSKLEMGCGFLAVPLLFDKMGTLREKCQKWLRSDGNNVTTDLFTSGLSTTVSATESAILFDTLGAVSLKDSMKTLKTFFWTPLGLLGLIGIFQDISIIEASKKAREGAKDDRIKDIHTNRINLGYLSILQSVTLVAMACIALVSIFFAAAAQGFLFQPLVMMTLSSAWLILNFVNYFYERAIDRSEAALPYGRV